MKTIGYIYRYDSTEDKGLLLYGYKEQPIKFSLKDCITNISEQKLVYFNLPTHGETSDLQIEQVSLINLKKDVIEYIASFCNQSNHPEYIRHTQIWFINTEWDENINDVTIDELYNIMSQKRHSGTLYNAIDLLNLALWITEDDSHETIGDLTIVEILYLYNFFECKKPNEFANREVCDFRCNAISEHWAYIIQNQSESNLSKILACAPKLQPCFPIKFCLKNIDRLNVLYSFPSISVCSAFYKRQIEKISNASEYTELYNQIENAINYDYDFYEDCSSYSRSYDVLINTYNPPQYLGPEKKEFVFLQNLPNRVLTDLLKKLQLRYDKLISEYAHSVVLKLDENIGVEQLITLIQNESLLKIESFITKLNKIRCIEDITELIHYNFQSDSKTILLPLLRLKFKSVLKSHIATINNTHCVLELSDTLRKFSDYIEPSELKELVRELFNLALDSTLNNIIQNNGHTLSAYAYYYLLRDHSAFISKQTFKQLKISLNLKFSQLIDVQELQIAYSIHLITRNQFRNQFQKITSLYNLTQLMEYVSTAETIPLVVQPYLLQQISSALNTSNLPISDSLSDCTENSCIAILNWFNQAIADSKLDSKLVNKAIVKFITTFSVEYRWKLFENRIIKVLPQRDILKRISKAYSDGSNPFYLNEDCFQTVLTSRLKSESDMGKLSWICAHLTADSQKQITNGGNRFLIFLVWANNLESQYDVEWDLIEDYFHSLPNDSQISVFNYLIYLYACNFETFSISELSSRLTNNGRYDICNTLKIILFFLNKKLGNSSHRISSQDLRKVLGISSEEDFNLIFKQPSFLTNLFRYFTKCYGLLNVSPERLPQNLMNDEIETLLVLGKLDEEPYFILTFVDKSKPTPYEGIDDYSSYQETVDEFEALLGQNFPVKKFGDDLWIPYKYLNEVKRFIIKFRVQDCCSLMSFSDSHLLLRQKYKNSNFLFCKSSRNCWSENSTSGIPFCWCDRNPCFCYGKFMSSPEDWRNYLFIDLLYILLNQELKNRDIVLDIESELAQFLNLFLANPFADILSDTIHPDNEIGI